MNVYRFLVISVVCLCFPVLGADVDFSIVVSSDGLLTISYTSTTSPRGIALNLDLGGLIITDDSDVISYDATFNCLMDEASEDPENYVPGVGVPLADPDVAGFLTYPAGEVSFCVGYLDENGNQAAGPASSSNLLSLSMSGAEEGTYTITVAEDSVRSGIVGDNGVRLSTNLPITVDYIPSSLCFPESEPDYENWVKAGYPACWCYSYQCKGDTNNLFSGKDKAGSRIWVDSEDLATFLKCWQLRECEPDFVTYDCACCDFNHDFSGKDKDCARIWVDSSDLTIFLAGWQKKDDDIFFSTECLSE